jgi:hypothetical protein
MSFKSDWGFDPDGVMNMSGISLVAACLFHSIGGKK